MRKNNNVKRAVSLLALSALALSLCACKEKNSEPSEEPEVYNHYEVDVYFSDEERQAWFEPIVKLISNQQEPYGNPAEGIIGYIAPRPDEPSIESGFNMGLFDVTGDGTPELLLDKGGGSAGNDYFYVYDIFSGEIIATLDGGGEKAWAVYYDIENNKYFPVGRYDWRVGCFGSMHFVTTIQYSEANKVFCEKGIFYSALYFEEKHVESEDGDINEVEFVITDAEFKINGEDVDFQHYHYELSEFYQSYSLVPNTGLLLYDWSDVSDAEDSYRERAEKMAQMLLYGSGQRFVKTVK